VNPAVPSAVRAVGVAGLACVAYGSLVERRWFRRRDVVLAGALREGPPLTVIHVADTHLSGPDPRLAAHLAEVLAAVDPDLVVATGDLCGAEGSEPAVVELLAHLTSTGVPALATLGSNDRWAPAPKHPLVYFTDPDHRILGPRLDTAGLVTGLEASGWRVLEDERDTLDVGGRRVAVAALHDPHESGRVLPELPDVDLHDVDDVDLRLGLVHAPYTAAVDLLARAGCDVVLAGHTHGGQVRLPGVGALTANCDLPLGMARGASRWGDAWLHVTPGLGQSDWAPFRFGCRPEVSVLHLTA
jgi:predicted MPP superfamily phosphohydrolase